MLKHKFFGRFFLIFGLSVGPLVATDEAQSAPGNTPNLGICNGNSKSEALDELCGSTEYPSPWAPEYKHIPVNCSKDPSAIQTALKRSEQESHVILLVSGACKMDEYNRITDRVVIITGGEPPPRSYECEEPQASIDNEFGYLYFDIRRFAQVTFRCLRLPANTFFDVINSNLWLDKLENSPEAPMGVWGIKQSRVTISPALDCCTPPSFFARFIGMNTGSYVSAFGVTMTNGRIFLNDHSSGNFGLAGDVSRISLNNADMYLGGGTGVFNNISGFELSIDNLSMSWGSKAHISFRAFIENGTLQLGSQLFAGRELIQNYTADETSYPPY